MATEQSTDFDGAEGTTTDEEGRVLHLTAVGECERDARSGLVSMYDDFPAGERTQGVPPVETDRCAAWIDGLLDGGINVVAWHEGQAIGHAALLDEPSGRGHELAVFVDPDYREAGVGTALVESVLERGRRRGVERVFLSVERSNRAAVSLYWQFDFEVVRGGSLEVEMAYTP